MSNHEDPEYEMIMPLVVCKTNGGPYDDLSFVVGMRYAEIVLALQTLPVFGVIECVTMVENGLVPQLDLLAMHYGWSLETTPCETEGVDETWTEAKFTKLVDGEPHA